MPWTFLVVQSLRICLQMQGTQVPSLVREDPTCRGAAKPVHHNYWAHVRWLPEPSHLEPVLRNKRSHCSEKPAHCNQRKVLAQQWRPSAIKIIIIFFLNRVRPVVKDREVWHAAVPGVANTDMTERLNNKCQSWLRASSPLSALF